MTWFIGIKSFFPGGKTGICLETARTEKQTPLGNKEPSREMQEEGKTRVKCNGEIDMLRVTKTPTVEDQTRGTNYSTKSALCSCGGLLTLSRSCFCVLFTLEQEIQMMIGDSVQPHLSGIFV